MYSSCLCAVHCVCVCVTGGSCEKLLITGYNMVVSNKVSSRSVRKRCVPLTLLYLGLNRRGENDGSAKVSVCMDMLTFVDLG